MSRQARGTGWNPAQDRHGFKRAIPPDLKSMKCSIAIGQAVEESTVVALGHINRVAAISCHGCLAICIEQFQAPIMAYPEAGK